MAEMERRPSLAEPHAQGQRHEQEEGGAAAAQGGGGDAPPAAAAASPSSSSAAKGPTAFTIDFDDDAPSHEQRAKLKKKELMVKKKLELKEGLMSRHYSPPAMHKKLTSASATRNVSATSTRNRNRSGGGEGDGTASQGLNGDPPAHLVSRGGAVFLPRLDLEDRLSAPARAPPPPAPVVPKAPAADQDDSANSEAGTYTIDEEDDDPADGVTPRAEVQQERQKIPDVFGVQDGGGGSSGDASSDWVSQWAADASQAGGNYAGDSPSHSREENSRSRRRLPATPEGLKGHTSPPQSSHHALRGADVSSSPQPETTSNYLQDTMSVMAAMEARINNCDISGSSGSRKSTSNAASPRSAVLSEKEERRLAWERRKNYNPLRDQAKSSTAAAATAHNYTTTTTEESCSDTCSEIDNSNLLIREERRATSNQYQSSSHHNNINVNNNNNNMDSVHNKAKCLPSTRPNRAFALRKKTNSSMDGSAGPSSVSLVSAPSKKPVAPTSSSPSMNREDTGRFSLRNRRPLTTSASHAPASLQMTSVKKTLLKKTWSGSPGGDPGQARGGVRGGGGRSSSSLSSKEAEFQAWKRRKNYNPMRSAAAATVKGKTTSTPQQQPSPQQSQPHQQQQQPASSVVAHYHQQQQQQQLIAPRLLGRGGLMAASAIMDNGAMQRSASFHYPDGLSRVQHNVYTSEDESPDDELLATSMHSAWEPRDLLEVTEDELVLPIGGRFVPSESPSSAASAASASAGARYHQLQQQQQVLHQSPRRSGGGIRSSGGGGGGSSSGLGRMEALDNLVISTIFSVSTKLCLNSASLIRRAQDTTGDDEQQQMMDTLLYVLEDTDLPASPSKKTSRELAGTLRNLKKVEQALEMINRVCFEQDDAVVVDDDADDLDGDEELEEEDDEKDDLSK